MIYILSVSIISTSRLTAEKEIMLKSLQEEHKINIDRFKDNALRLQEKLKAQELNTQDSIRQTAFLSSRLQSVLDEKNKIQKEVRSEPYIYIYIYICS